MKKKRKLLPRFIAANCLIILTMTVGGVFLARYFHGVSDTILMIVLGTAGTAIAALACYFILRNYLKPLLDFSKAVETIHEGMSLSALTNGGADPTIDGVIHSVRNTLNRLEDESLRHTTQLLNSIEAERQRIGRELHDQTSQTLATALINIKLADSSLGKNSSQARKKLASAKELIEHSMEQIKICVYDLRPVMLDDLGLVPTLRWHIKTHMTGTGITVAADFDDAGERAPRVIETTLYRIAQEALANVIRHSNATRVTVRLETRQGYAALAIADNGRGFDPEKVIQSDKKDFCGLGLYTIRERVRLVKGTLNIESAAGEGTRIHVVLPIAAARDLDIQENAHDKSIAGG